MGTSKKQNKWVKPRHRRATRIIDFFFRPYALRRYGITVDEFCGDKTRPYLILMNHQTAYDQFFLGIAFGGEAVYYVASEDIFSLGLASKIIKYLVNPIPIKKQSADARAVINCIRVAKEGGNIAMAPEGNRTYSGRTGYFNPAVAPLARKLGLPIAFFRIEGGYGVHPRWADDVRRGKMHGYVSRVVEKEEYSALSDEELVALIKAELYVDEAKVDGEYISKNPAERLERVIYVCPKCGFSSFCSEGDRISCTSCGLTARYTSTKELVFDGADIDFRFVADWYDYQERFVNLTDTVSLTENPVFYDSAAISEVIPYKRKRRLEGDVKILLFGNRVEISGKKTNLEISFSEASAFSVLGKNKLNVYFKDKVYQIKGDKGFNALKYLNFYHRFTNIIGGEGCEFLGL